MRGKNLRHRAPSHPSNLSATFSAVRFDRQLEICLKTLPLSAAWRIISEKNSSVVLRHGLKNDLQALGVQIASNAAIDQESLRFIQKTGTFGF